MRITHVRQHTRDVKAVSVKFLSEEKQKNFSFRVGQFGIFSVFGEGESTFNICSSSNWKDHLEFCFRKTGQVTEAMWRLEEGDEIGFRGPYGNGYPMEQWEGKNLIFAGGGIAMPPIRCAMWYALENREKFGDITLVYGAKTAQDHVFVEEMEEWSKRPNVRVIRCVDPGSEKGWDGEVGFVPSVMERSAIKGGNNAIALVIGPPVMIKASMPVLYKMGLTPESIYTSLENRMKCGLGKCGRCNIGTVYVCKDGPVFTLKQLNELPNDF